MFAPETDYPEGNVNWRIQQIIEKRQTWAKRIQPVRSHLNTLLQKNCCAE